MRVIRMTFASMIAMTVAATALADPATPPNNPVVFAFAWPEGQTVRVINDTNRPDAQRRAPLGSYTLVLAPDGHGWRARATELVSLIAEGSSGELHAKAMPPAIAALLGAEFRVGADGRYKGLVDVAAAQQAARAWIGPRASGAQLVDAASSLQVVEAMVSDLWEPIVGQWAGATFNTDTEYAFDAQQPLPVAGGASVPTKGHLIVRAAPPCMRGGTPRTCVWLEVSQTADPLVLAKVLGESVRHLSDGTSKPEEITAASMVVTRRLLSEPTGLIPHEYIIEKRIQIGAAPSTEARSIVQTERRTFDFVPAAPVSR